MPSKKMAKINGSRSFAKTKHKKIKIKIKENKTHLLNLFFGWQNFLFSFSLFLFSSFYDVGMVKKGD